MSRSTPGMLLRMNKVQIPGLPPRGFTPLLPAELELQSLSLNP